MDYIRAALSTIVFIVGGFLVYDVVMNGFSPLMLLIAIGCFVASHYLWPKNATEAHDWFCWLGDVIEAPGRFVIWLSMKAIRLLRGDWDDVF